jgi:hypothetical protein
MWSFSVLVISQRGDIRTRAHTRAHILTYTYTHAPTQHTTRTHRDLSSPISKAWSSFFVISRVSQKPNPNTSCTCEVMCGRQTCHKDEVCNTRSGAFLCECAVCTCKDCQPKVACGCTQCLCPECSGSGKCDALCKKCSVA